MRKEERQKAILGLLNATDPISTRTLTEHFHVADMTIRRDLIELAAQGRLMRTFGGAVLVNGEAQRTAGSASSDTNTEASSDTHAALRHGADDRIPELAYQARAREHGRQKAAIAGVCVSLMEGRDSVYLDSGSTTLSIARLASPDMPCIFLTNGINIAFELLRRECASVISIGGEIHLNTWSTRGAFTETQLRALHADVAFLGCNAISPEGGVMIGNMIETGVKRAIMDVAHEIYLVADSSKFDSYSLTAYASVGDFTGIITDSLLPAETKERLEALGAHIVIAE